MADYKIRLTADTTQHDRALNQSAQEVYKYTKRVETTKKSLGGLAKKFIPLASAAGAVNVAVKEFGVATKMNQQLADSYGRTMQMCRTANEQFMLSLSTADFSGFISNLVNARTNAKKLYDAMDALATQKILSKGKLAEINARLVEARLDARQGKKGAKQTIKLLEQALEDELLKQEPLIKKNIQTKIEEVLGWNSAKDGAINVDMVLDWSQKGESAIQAEIDRLKRYQNELDIQYNGSTKGLTNASRYGKWGNEYWSAEKQIDLLRKVKGRLTDGDALSEVQDLISSYWALRQSIAQAKLGNNRYTGGGSTSKTDNKPSFQAGSIADIEARISALEGRLKNEALTAVDATRIQTSIDALELQKQAIELSRQPLVKLSSAIEEIPPIELKVLNSDEFISEIQQAIDGIETLGMTIDDLENMGNIGDAFQSIGEMVQSMSGVVSEESAKMISAIGNSISIIGQALSSISAMMLAKGAASVMDLPFPANLAALTSIVGAVMGVISQIKSINSETFADGGIISGSTTIGDMNLARVNSGEMILNNGQQARLFRMLNTSSVFNGFSNDNGNVTFTIKGADLVGTLNNYQNKRKRVI